MVLIGYIIVISRAGVSMKEKEKYVFFDTGLLTETEGIRERCDVNHLTEALKERFPDEEFTVTSVSINETGRYTKRGSALDRMIGVLKPVTGLPAYCEVVIRNRTGKFFETIYICTY